MWAGSDVCGLLAANVGPFAHNVGLTYDPFAANVGRVKQRLWASRITFVDRYRYRYLWVVGYSFRDEHII